MKRFYQLTFRYMFKNGRRTLTTLIGVVVSAMLLFLLFEIPYSVRQSRGEYDFRRAGGMDVSVEHVDPETAIRMREDAKASAENGGKRMLAGEPVSKLWITVNEGYMLTTLIDDFSEMAIPVETDRGTLPKNDSEVIVTHGAYEMEEQPAEEWQWDESGNLRGGGLTKRLLRIGDTITVFQHVRRTDGMTGEEWNAWVEEQYGPSESWTEEEARAVSEESQKTFRMPEKTLHVCGYLKDSERLLAYQMVSVLTDEYLRECDVKPTVSIVLEHPENVDPAEYRGRIMEQYGISGSEEGGAYVILYPRVQTEEDEAAFDAFLLLIALAFSILLLLMIRNAFNISVDERLQDYGVLRCVGLTRRQIFKMLLLEAFLVALAGSVLGILLGYGLAAGGLQIASKIPFVQNLVGINFTLHAIFSWKAILYPTFVVFLATAMSMISPVEKLFRMSPVDAQRKREKVRRPKGKSLVDRRKPGIEGIYGFRSARRARGRYIRTVVSFALGLALVTGVGTMVQTAFRTEYTGLHRYDLAANADESAEQWSELVQSLKNSDASEGMEGGIVYWEMVIRGESSSGSPIVKQVIEGIGVTDGIWEALLREMEDPAEGVSLTPDSDGTVEHEPNGTADRDSSDAADPLNFPALAVLPSYSHDPAHAPGDTFALGKTDISLCVAGTVTEDSAGQILSGNMGVFGSNIIDTASDLGTYIFPIGNHTELFNDIQPEVIWTDPENDRFRFWDSSVFGCVSVESTSGRKAEVRNLLLESVRPNSVYEMEDTLAGLTLVRNVFLLALAFVLIISTINAINVSREEQFARRDETFMLRAIGMSERQRRRMLLSESMSASLLAVILGVGIGLAISGIVTAMIYKGSGLLGGFHPDTMRIRFTPDYVSILISAAGILLTGWITSLFVRKDGGICECR
ncbi:MAG: ABC transporter permease [Eubacterium sp.]|nr:ABC transporter permease [Eubacterium sp.]